jgi:hypothetical protein
MGKIKLISIIIEVIGVAATGAGIGVELATQADIGWATITIGSCLVAIGGVIWGKFIKGGLK